MICNIPEDTVLDEKYRILLKLGEGGFGEVYLAENLLLQNRRVAIKSLKLDDPDREQFFIREMQFLSDLDHPHVVRFYHHFRHHDALFLVMEFCSGGSLWQALQKKGQFDSEKVIIWAISHQFKNMDYIMETFPIVNRKAEAAHGYYRTKATILETYDAIAEFMRTGQPCQTRLDPPPGPPENGLPEWKPGQPKPKDWPSHIHVPKEVEG